MDDLTCGGVSFFSLFISTLQLLLHCYFTAIKLIVGDIPLSENQSFSVLRLIL